MKNILIFTFLTLVVLQSCNKSEIGNVDLVFEANFGTEILELGKDYELLDGRKFEINKTDFFLSDVRLVSNDGREKELFEFIQVDFSDSPGGVKFSVADIDAINYESIQFNLGLNEDLNKTRPEDYEADSPLNNSGYYWEGWSSYIFSKTEGKVEDEDGNITEGYIFHTGTDDLLKEVSLVLDRTLISGEDNEIRIGFDHAPLFQKNGEVIELGFNHDPSTTLNEFITRMSNSFSIK